MNTLLSTVRPSTLQPNSTQPNSTTSHSTFGISPKSEPSLKQLEAGIHAKTLCRGPHRSVGPAKGTHLPEEGGQKEKNITRSSPGFEPRSPRLKTAILLCYSPGKISSLVCVLLLPLFLSLLLFVFCFLLYFCLFPSLSQNFKVIKENKFENNF